MDGEMEVEPKLLTNGREERGLGLSLRRRWSLARARALRRWVRWEDGGGEEARRRSGRWRILSVKMREAEGAEWARERRDWVIG